MARNAAELAALEDRLLNIAYGVQCATVTLIARIDAVTESIEHGREGAAIIRGVLGGVLYYAMENGTSHSDEEIVELLISEIRVLAPQIRFAINNPQTGGTA